MNTHDLRQSIKKTIKKEAKSGKLRKLLTDQLSEAEVEATINFIKGYILQTPDILDQVYAAASNAGGHEPQACERKGGARALQPG